MQKQNLQTLSQTPTVDLKQIYMETQIQDILDILDQELVGLLPVKSRIKEIAALLVLDQLRKSIQLTSNNPGLHQSYTGNPGTGKTTIALRMANILYKLNYCRKGHLLTVTRDDLVGQYIGHTAPKTKEVLKKAKGGLLFIDEAYYLYKPDNERDYGAEAIEILLQVMENQRDDLVLILAGYKEKMDQFYQSNPGLSSRIANHINFPDFTSQELLQITEQMLEEQQYKFAPETIPIFLDYIKIRSNQLRFSNARSIRNAIERARLRSAERLFKNAEILTKADLTIIQPIDVSSSSVFNNNFNYTDSEFIR